MDKIDYMSVVANATQEIVSGNSAPIGFDKEEVFPDISVEKVTDNLATSLPDNIDYEIFRSLMKRIDTSFSSTAKNWKAKPYDKLNIYNNILRECYLIDYHLNNGLDWNEIKDSMIRLLKFSFAICVKDDLEIMFFSLFNTFETELKLNKDKFLNEFWDSMLMPLAMKQNILIVLKSFEMWFYLGMDFEKLNLLLIEELKKEL